MAGVAMRLAMLLLLLASGCAATVESDPQARAFTKVAVVSVAGSYLTQMNVGMTVFGNENAEIDVSSWNLDATFAEAVAEAVRERKRLVTMDSRWVAAQEMFKRMAARDGVDALVVLVPVTSGDYFNLTVVISGRTGMIISDTDVSSEPKGNFGAGRQRAQPSIAIPPVLARKPLQQMSQSELDEVKAFAQRLPMKAAATVSIPNVIP